MIACSVQAIDTNEVGIETHKYYEYVLSDELWEEGTHWVWLWGDFETETKINQNKDYTVTANTNNIIEVTVDVSIQYQIKPTYNDVYQIVFEFDDMGEYFDVVVEDAIRRGVQSLSSDTFYSDRQILTDVISAKVGLQLTDLVTR
eukprot:UN26164